jgi:DEAD/DEAH box helicase domain-containing protein
LIKIDQETIEIKLSLKRKRTPKQTIKLIKELTNIFNLIIDKYWFDNPAVEELLKVNTNQLNGIDLFVGRYTKDYILYSLPKQHARFSTINLSPKSKTFLSYHKISKLYSHQVEAIEAIRKGHHTVISTSTSSGKSLIYQLPILESIEKDSQSCFLLLFPTKALAQDQKERFNLFPFTNTAIYDGDTMKSERITIRNTCNIILSNPDMLHVSILPHHNLWIRFILNLKFVMIDEIHYYYDEFGAHLRLLLLRLKRICAFYGNTGIIFVGCSATISNPLQHFGALIGAYIGVVDSEGSEMKKIGDSIKVVDSDRSGTKENSEDSIKVFDSDGSGTEEESIKVVDSDGSGTKEKSEESIKVVDSDGSGTEEKTCIVWRPNRSNSNLKFSSIEEAIRVIICLCRCEIKTLVFVKSRQQCEVLFKEVIKTRDLESKVIAYRGGYSASERRLIEKQIYADQVLVVISTNALELGIDIGDLDCVVHLGFPLTVSSFQQQSGRAGRRSKKSLDIFIPEANSIDQHYANNLGLLIPRRNTQSLQNSLSKDIMSIHLNCAAKEFPITKKEVVFFGKGSIYTEVCISSLRYDAVKNVLLIKIELYPAYEVRQ